MKYEGAFPNLCSALAGARASVLDIACGYLAVYKDWQSTSSSSFLRTYHFTQRIDELLADSAHQQHYIPEMQPVASCSWKRTRKPKQKRPKHKRKLPEHRLADILISSCPCGTGNEESDVQMSRSKSTALTPKLQVEGKQAGQCVSVTLRCEIMFGKQRRA